MTQPTTRKPLRRMDRKAKPSSDQSTHAPGDVSQAAIDPDVLEKQLAIMQIDQATADRIRKLPKDVGWLLFTAGIVGLVVPGVIGTPFLVLGSLMLWPKSKKKAELWLSGQSPKAFAGSMKQINRFLDDLEQRYPKD
jgi:hypothetical protein